MAPFDVDKAYSSIQETANLANPANKTDAYLADPKLVAELAELAIPQEYFSKENTVEADGFGKLDGELSLSLLTIQMEYITDTRHCIDALSHLLSASLISVDIETARKDKDPRSGLDPYKAQIRLVQLYDGKDTVYVFDCFKEEVWSALSSSRIWSQPMVAHNALFELKHLNKAGIRIPNIGCTMLQSNAISGQLPKLSSLVVEYLHRDLSKEQQVSDWAAKELSKEQLEYAALDAVVTYQIAHIQAEKLEHENLSYVYRTMKNAQASVADMELNGFLFDLDKHRILVDRWKEEKDAATKKLSEILVGINLNSGKQVSDWLQKTLDKDTLGKWPRTAKGQLKTDANSFSQYPELQITQPLLAYKNLAKKLSTYGETYRKHINSITGRIHSNYRLGGTFTGRISCSSPNLQQIPRDPGFRSLFIAPPGKLLAVADYSQIQLRIAALLSKDKNMLEAFIKGEDLHKQTAAAILAIPASDITKEQRQMGKAVSFGLLFGQGAHGLARYAKSAYGIEMSEHEASEARSIFFRTYPELAYWQRLTGMKAKRQMQVTTPGGRVRDFNREKMGYKFTEALNTPIQGAEAEILMNTLGLFSSRPDSDNLNLVNVVHDELVFEIDENNAPIVKQVIKKFMVDGFLMSFPNAGEMTNDLVEIGVGPNWHAAK